MDGKQFVESAFPLPLKSAMDFTDNGQSGYGEQQLTILIGDSNFSFDKFNKKNSLYNRHRLFLIKIIPF